MAAGLQRAEAGDYARAILEFRNAAKQMPKDARPYYRLALCYLEVDDPAGTVVSLQKALQLKPDYVEAHLKMAEILVATRRPEALGLAVEKLNTLLAKHPGHAGALELRAQAELALGKLEDAERTLAEVPDRARRGSAIRLLSLIHIGRKDYAAAEQSLKENAAREPNSVQAAVALGRLYRIMGKPADAEAEFRRALRINDSDPQALTDMAMLRIDAHRTPEAREFFQKLATLPQPRYKLAWVRYLAGTGETANAMKILEQLERQFPRDRSVRSTLVRSYVAQARAADARQILDRALAANRSDVDALGQRAELNLVDGRLQQAHEDLMSLLQNRPESGEAHFLLAQVYRQKGLPALEKQELREALRFTPSLLPARIALVQILVRAREARAALDLINSAPESQKGTVPAVVERNWSLLALGERDAARESIERALAQQTGNADLLLQDGLLKLAEGKPAAARARLEPALKRWPEDTRILDAIVASYRAEKQDAVALDLVRTHAARNLKSIAVQEYLGLFLASRGDIPGARAAFQAVLAAGGKRKPAASLELARLAAREGNMVEARGLLNGMLAADPEHPAARRMLAMVEQAAGNAAQALDHYQRLVAVDDHDPVVLNNLAWLLAEHARQPDLALKYAQRARELAPRTAPAIDDTLGRIYYQKGLYRTAIQHFENGMKKETTGERAFHLAQAYLKSGQQEQAQRTYKTALRLSPSLPALE